jgi:UDP-N-acetylmuramoyl-tripeptide--D-alanyl-D-alanine ligase
MPAYANTIIVILVYLSYLAFATKRSMTYLHIYQQEEYDTSRFLRWMSRTRAFDMRLSIILLVIDIFWLMFPHTIFGLLYFVAFAMAAYVEKDPRRNSKKKLAMTPRAQRILFITLVLCALMGTWFFLLALPLMWIVTIQLIPFLMLLANTVLIPYEKHTQKKFMDEAHARLRAVKPTVIGITGSYGKTSVKHILGHILKTHASTLITPGSVNTPMGITRIIREQLEDNHKFFVVEMGAYGPGSVARLCMLTPPDIGVITAIGHAHYERFKTIETVAQAKFELAQAAIARGGKVIVHEQALALDYSRKLAEESRSSFVVVGGSNMVDAVVERAEQTRQGLIVYVRWDGHSFRLEAPLFGLHHGQNMALAFATAVTLGLTPEHVMTAMKSVPQITHRLEVKPQPDGTILIDDAYNSNPPGFESALRVLPVFGGRKILVTPGMVELGDEHGPAHETIGKIAGEICDIAVVVNAARIPSFVTGFKSTGSGKQLVEVESFAAASAWLDQNRKTGDVVLLENDLPDLYESRLRI